MPQQKLVVLYGSPRSAGFTNAMVEQVIAQAPDHWEVVRYDAYRMQVRPCIDCRLCEKGACPLNQRDDFQKLLDLLQHADAILLASPIYFSGFPAPLKAIVDRSQQFFMNRADNRTRCFANRRRAYLLLAAGASSQEVNRSMVLSAEMFLRCMNADLCAQYILEQTDARTLTPPLPADFVAQIFG